MNETKRSTCPCCGGDGWLYVGLTLNQETCPRCMGRGTVVRGTEWRQRISGLCIGLGFALALLGAMFLWGAR